MIGSSRPHDDSRTSRVVILAIGEDQGSRGGDTALGERVGKSRACPISSFIGQALHLAPGCCSAPFFLANDHFVGGTPGVPERTMLTHYSTHGAI
jgi:hypothetical protein